MNALVVIIVVALMGFALYETISLVKFIIDRVSKKKKAQQDNSAINSEKKED